MNKRSLILSIFFLGVLKSVLAGDPCLDDPIFCPIDGGASLLVGAGVAYGMKKIRDNKKSRKDLKDTI